MLGIIVLPLSIMVPCKETRAVIIALHTLGILSTSFMSLDVLK